ncbi:hypothetical protein K2X85_17960 [bacterium]|nr:hypothetical protein [bacterium]
MARRGSGSDDTVSLFPFLSILVCVIGILTLMIVASSLGDMGKKPDAILVEQTRRFNELKAQLTQNQKAVEDLHEKLQGSELGQARIDSVQKELDRLQEIAKTKLIEQEKFSKSAELAQLRDSLKARLEQLNQEQKNRETVTAELEKEIEAKGRPPEATVSIRATGSGRDMVPVFVECSDAGIVLHEGTELKRIRSADIGIDPDFLAMLDKTSKQEKGILIFLLRDNGLATFYAAKGVADERGVRTGRIPVVGQGNIDLSAVMKKQRRQRERN